MRIALLHDSILPPANYGGIERIVLILAREYQRQGHVPVIFTRAQSSVEKIQKSVGSSVQVVGLEKQDFDGPGLSETLKQNHIDFLHSHQPLKVKPTTPFLVTIHGNGHPGEHYWPNTNFLSQKHAENHNAKYFVYNGLDPQEYPFVEQKKDFYVFLAKTTWRVKNVKTAVAWAEELKIKLHIMGGFGKNSQYVTYEGLVDDKLKIKLLSEAKALIYPTNWDEPCAAAPLEALVCGTPVITSLNGCMPELVSAKTGALCQDYSDLLKAPMTISKLKPIDCRKSCEDMFSLKRMATDYLELMNKILKTGELDHQPQVRLDPKNQKWLFKPTLKNKILFQLRGKI